MDLLWKHQHLLWYKYHIDLDRGVQYMWQRAGRIKLEWKSSWELCVGAWILHLCKDGAGESASASFLSHNLRNRGGFCILAYAVGMYFPSKLTLVSSISVLRYLVSHFSCKLPREVYRFIQVLGCVREGDRPSYLLCAILISWARTLLVL